jgi:predicted nucleotidyltransferase
MDSAFSIRPQDLAIVQAILEVALPPDAKIGVFGSRAKGTTKRGADLDLAIDLGTPLTQLEAFQLADAFEESDLPYKVDVVDMHRVAPSFKAIIEHEIIALELLAL